MIVSISSSVKLTLLSLLRLAAAIRKGSICSLERLLLSKTSICRKSSFALSICATSGSFNHDAIEKPPNIFHIKQFAARAASACYRSFRISICYVWLLNASNIAFCSGESIPIRMLSMEEPSVFSLPMSGNISCMVLIVWLIS